MADQLADGVVTSEEYQVAYSAQVTCREEAGWTFDSAAAVWNPVDHLKLIRRGEAPPNPDPSMEIACNEQFDYVDFLYQTQTTPQMDPQLLSAVQACLDRSGLSYFADATNLSELVGSDASSSTEADTIASCVSGEAARLFPDLPGLSIAF